MAGDDEPEGYLEREEANDPVKRQEKLLRRAEEMMEMGARLARPAMGRVEAFTRPTSITLSIRRISNGFIMAQIPEGTHGYATGELARFEEIYFSTINDLAEASDRAIRVFAAELGVSPTPGRAGVVGDSPSGSVGTHGNPPSGVGSDLPDDT